MMQIRPVKEADLLEIQQVAQITWLHTYSSIFPKKAILQFLQQAYSLESLKKSLEIDCQRPKRLFYIATDKDRIIGYGQLMERASFEYELARIYLLPEYQGKGIGKQLLKQLISAAYPLRQMFAWVEKENLGARAFYDAMHFQVEEESEENFFGTKTTLLKYVRKWEQ